ncbi:MAG TPA: M24 family metallopeptidase [Propionibacteriaceae bacterium]|nr:M24 family metallopeptidase [Propionibacteriaceae bacterium]
MTPVTERELKRQRIIEILDRRQVDAVVLTSATTLGWYLDGARTHVGLAAEPVLAVRVDRSGDEVWLTSNEASRLIAEELPPNVTVRQRPWYEPLPPPEGWSESELERELWAARWPLLPAETARFRQLGSDAAEVLTGVLTAAEPGWTERRVAAEVARGLVDCGADPLVVLVGGVTRSGLPHPLPTDAEIGERALVVACARRHGLIANLSRLVAFRPLTLAERALQERILSVEERALDATQPDAQLSDVLAAIDQGYRAAGFGAEHWRGHHQGGIAGYAGRDPRATPTTDHRVQIGQAFAWNPWAPGAKVEDTCLLTPSGMEMLTVDSHWPTVAVGGRLRPDVLVR